MKQLKLFNEKVSREFGGSKLKGKRKTKRPIDTKKSLHLILKARQSHLLLKQPRLVRHLAQTLAKKFGVQIYSIAVNSDHIHFSIKAPTREAYVKWIRAFSSRLAQLMGIKWTLRPYSRIVTWGRDFKRVLTYLRDNQFEGEFIIKWSQTVENWARSFKCGGYSGV